MALWQKTVAPFSEHKGGVGPFLEIPRSNSACAIDNANRIIRDKSAQPDQINTF